VTSPPEALLTHAQQLPGGLPIVPAPAASSQARAALSVIIPIVTAGWSHLTTDVIADCGRIDPDSTSMEAIGQADAVVVVVRPQLADLHHLAARATDLKSRCRSLAVVLAGAGPYTSDEVADAVGADVLGAIPSDPTGANLLGGQAGSRRGLSRTALMRAARDIASTLATIEPEHAADNVAGPTSGNGTGPTVEVP
jgi:MinD-like ATPase involved in chromosome partitioning or flagellar assembly